MFWGRGGGRRAPTENNNRSREEEGRIEQKSETTPGILHIAFLFH